MARTRATVRQNLQIVVNPLVRIGNKNILNRIPRNIPPKVKKLLPQRELWK